MNSSNIAKQFLKFKKLSSLAVIPTKGTTGAVGYDLYSIQSVIVKARSKEMISTGLAVAIPPGSYGRVAPRSGLTWKNSIDVGAGVVDPDYRGECKYISLIFSKGYFIQS
jgi:dUTP pyrophosphatase